MARISVWFVRTSLLHFALGATAGAWRLAATGGWGPGPPLPLRALHVEVMLLGWVCQLALGVALWIFPFSGSVSGDRRFWGAWAALNGGILLVVAGRWSGVPRPVLLGRVAEIGAAALLIGRLWPRLRPIPRPSRPSPRRATDR
jgi:hypothetical protein